MNKARVVIAPLKIEEISAMARIHMAANPGSLLTVLGHRAVCRYYEWFMLEPHEHRIALGAYENDILIGYMISAVFHGTVSGHVGYIQRNRGFLIGQIVSQPWLIRTHVLQAEIRKQWKRLYRRLVPAPVTRPPATEHYPPPNSIELGIIVFSPDHRGIGALLLTRETKKIAARMGFEYAHHQIDPHNDYNLRFYEMQGHDKVLNSYGEWHGRMIVRLEQPEANREAGPSPAPDSAGEGISV